MKRALIVVDVQAYFLKKAPAGFAKKIADHIKKSDYELVAFSIFKNHPGSNWERSLNWDKCDTDADTRIPDELEEFATRQNVFIKDTYSVFKNKKILDLLKQKQIEKVYVCGLDLDACVLATAFDAFDYGFAVEVLFDLSFSGDGINRASKLVIQNNMQSVSK